MKKSLIFLVSILTTFNIFANNMGPQLGTMFESGGAHYYVVRQFDTPEANNEFSRNVEIMRRYVNAIDAMREKIKTLPEGENKKTLQERLKQAEAEFASNDKIMQKKYAFSVARKYRQETYESNICVPISKEELSNLRTSDGKDLDPMLILERGNISYYRIKHLQGSEENAKLQKMLSYASLKKIEVEKMRNELAKTTEPEKQLEISGKLSALEKALKENDTELRKIYSIKQNSDYLVEVVRSKLFLMLNPDEVAKVAAELKARNSAQKNN